jgi:hypothetical protein
MNELSKNVSRVVAPAVPAENIVDGKQRAPDRFPETFAVISTEVER